LINSESVQSYPVTTIEEALQDTRLSLRDIRWLHQDAAFVALATRNEQIRYLDDLRDRAGQPLLTTKQLAEAFLTSSGNIRQIRWSARQQKRTRGRPRSIDSVTEHEIVDFITRETEQHRYITKSNLIQYVIREYANNVTTGWLRSFFQRNADQLGMTVALPQEMLRMQIPRSHLNE
jgi:hypothetical protein